MKILAAAALAVATLAAPASAGEAPWWMCPPYLGCPQFRPLGVPGQVNTPGPVGTPYYVGRTHGFIGGRRVIVQERTQIIIQQQWHVRCYHDARGCVRMR